MPPSQEAGVGDAGGTDAGCPSSPGFICLIGSCSNDVGGPPACTNGTWSCPTGYVACSGCTGNPPPGYVCADGGWVHVADAGGTG
jgi:hypothetical protein